MSDAIYIDTGKPKASSEILYMILLLFNMLNNYHKDEFTDEEFKTLSTTYTELAKMYNERVK